MNINIDTSKVEASLTKIAKNMKYATSRAINATMVESQQSVKQNYQANIDNPTKFTISGVQYRRTTKANLNGAVYIEQKRAQYLSMLLTGGTDKPKRKALRTPTRYAKLNSYGNLSRTYIETRLRNKKKYFSGTPTGGNRKAGLYERMGMGGRGRLRPLVMWDDEHRYSKQLEFHPIVRRVFDRRFQQNFKRELAAAMR